MTEASLQDRLRDHAKAFNGLLSLIPAKQYYGEDTSDQWRKKKQTKKEAAAARRGKLDPDSELNKNAKEVMDERARSKRKQRQEDEEVEDDEAQDEEEDGSFVAIEGVEAEQPGQGLRKATENPRKKQKVEPELDDDESGVEVDDEEDEEEAPATEETKLSKKEQKRAAKRERKAEKKSTKDQGGADEQPIPSAKPSKDQEAGETPIIKKQKSKKEAKAATKVDVDDDESIPDAKQSSGFAAHLDVSGLDGKDDSEAVSEPHSPTFDAAEPASTTTSVSSTIPPSEKPKHIIMPKDTSALKARLAAKIEALRAARKADGPDGKPIRTRQELIEARREKQAQRKEHKKELRRLAKLEEERKREEALATNSPGIMSPAVEEGNFSFGRVAFADGSQMSHDLSYVLNQGKRKGPSDAKTALLKVQNQKKRLEDMDVDTRADIAEKDAWLTARRRVEGEKIRDDEAILKKTIKRKEAGKKKSEKAWSDRLQGVSLAQKERVKKREDNLRKRRDEKLMGKSGKKKKGGAAGGGGKKKGGRPGFEGSFGMGGGKKK
ncbi:hypothetical protein LMH87_005848 [Akanthomyces muscarius]|uniref:Ribosome biogenesis protein Rrp14-C n=1 Tax=Akanthomyces muscarius TaxID=2231603 RepID=A0A9W8QLJ6_AKAMU|nr:hypothetical protein LMH87_005848 [Akanthomyces muscarius]KAJ4164163.1 hypothetical protein LMH87_005848 [Akanthomyces muscarius]